MSHSSVGCLLILTRTAMTSAQARLAETIETFYGAADATSEGAMAGHAYKASVDDLDSGIARELVRCLQSISVLLFLFRTVTTFRF